MNPNLEWKYIDGFSASKTSSTDWYTVGTYTELIGAHEILFTLSNGSYPVHVLNMGDGTSCNSMNTFIGSGASTIYNSCREFRVDFTTGKIEHRQIYGSELSKLVYNLLAYR